MVGSTFPDPSCIFCMTSSRFSFASFTFASFSPPHLQDAHYRGHEKLGHGTGYKYAHNYPNHYVEQQYLPSEIISERFYEPTEIGYEAEIREYFRRIGREN